MTLKLRSLIALPALLALLALGACGGRSSGTLPGEAAPELAAAAGQPMNLLVIGGSRGIGLETVKLALERGHRVTMMSRDPAKAGLAHPALTLHPGSILDPQRAASAVDGMDAVVITIGMGPTRDPVTLFSDGTRVVLEAMEAAGVERLLVVTGIGVAETRGHGGFFYDNILQPLALATIYEDKERQEALVRASDTRWTLLRPGTLNNDPANERYRVLSEIGDITVGAITRADTAHFILASLEQARWIGEAPIISEP